MRKDNAGRMIVFSAIVGSMLVVGALITHARLTAQSGIIRWPTRGPEPFSNDEAGRWLRWAVVNSAESGAIYTRTINGKHYLVRGDETSWTTGCFAAKIEIDEAPYRGQVCGEDKERAVPSL